MNQNRVAILATIVALVAASYLAGAAEITKDSLETVQKNIGEKKAVLADVREQTEWDKGHIEGAVFLPLSATPERRRCGNPGQAIAQRQDHLHALRRRQASDNGRQYLGTIGF